MPDVLLALWGVILFFGFPFYHKFASKGKYKLSTKVPPFLRPIKIQLERLKVFY